MFKCLKNKIWLENMPSLFCSPSLVPLDGMSLAEQMNSLTRLVIVIFIILLIIDYRFSGLFFLISLLFIIILYYIQKNNMERFGTENYSPPHKAKINVCPANSINDLGNSQRFANDDMPLDSVNGVGGVFNNPKWISSNQRLVGPANPKTLIPPVIVPPIADLGYWRGTNLTNFSQINHQGNTDLYRSGYIVSDNDQITEEYSGRNRNRHGGSNVHMNQRYDDKHTRGFKVYSDDRFGVSNNENYDHTYIGGFNVHPDDGIGGDIETSWGYNPQQLFTSSLPSNLAGGGISRNPDLKRYNEYLFTQTIQPGVYTKSEIVEPVNSNIGISFTQQFPPASSRIDPRTGALLRTEHDPRLLEPNWENKTIIHRPTEADVYDPRFTGYGTSYRSYVDDLLGQPRFYYDDINAIRMPNYISRSEIDNQPFADSYGPIPTGFENGNPYTGNIHQMAEKAFVEGALQHRTEMSERLMRKVNSEHWQRRAAPSRKSGGRMMGGYR